MSCWRKALLQTAVFQAGYAAAGYVGYNLVAKKLTRRLAALGGRAMVEQGLGDDQHPHGYEAALDPWLARLWDALRAEHPLPHGATEVCTVLVSNVVLALFLTWQEQPALDFDWDKMIKHARGSTSTLEEVAIKNVPCCSRCRVRRERLWSPSTV